MAAVRRLITSAADHLAALYEKEVAVCKATVDRLATVTEPLQERVKRLADRFNLRSRESVSIASGCACITSVATAWYFGELAFKSLVPDKKNWFHSPRNIPLGMIGIAIMVTNEVSSLIFFKMMISALQGRHIQLAHQPRDGHLPA